MLMINIIVFPAKGSYATDDALIGEHYAFPIVYRPLDVPPCECKPFLHMIPFEIRPLLLNICPNVLPS